MTRKEFSAAFTAWTLAIQEKFATGASESLGELVTAYGKDITTSEHLDEVAKCFDFYYLTYMELQ